MCDDGFQVEESHRCARGYRRACARTAIICVAARMGAGGLLFEFPNVSKVVLAGGRKRFAIGTNDYIVHSVERVLEFQ